MPEGPVHSRGLPLKHQVARKALKVQQVQLPSGLKREYILLSDSPEPPTPKCTDTNKVHSQPVKLPPRDSVATKRTAPDQVPQPFKRVSIRLPVRILLDLHSPRRLANRPASDIQSLHPHPVSPQMATISFSRARHSTTNVCIGR